MLRRTSRIPGSEDSLAHQIQKVLNSSELRGTDLLGVKRILSKYHPTTLAYQLGETGGYALESMSDLVQDFAREMGGDDRWNHYRTETEEKDHPTTCCSQILQYQNTWKLDGVFMLVENTASKTCSLQDYVDRWENQQRKKVKEVTCPTCSKRHAIQVTSLPEHMPSLFTFEFNPHSATVSDLAGKISWGGATYKPVGTIQHDDNHFWASLLDQEAEETWWRVDDFCQRVDTWRRKYVRDGNCQRTLPDGGLTVHKLEDKIVLVLLEKLAVQVNNIWVSCNVRNHQNQCRTRMPWTCQKIILSCLRYPQLRLLSNKSPHSSNWQFGLSVSTVSTVSTVVGFVRTNRTIGTIRSVCDKSNIACTISIVSTGSIINTASTVFTVSDVCSVSSIYLLLTLTPFLINMNKTQIIHILTKCYRTWIWTIYPLSPWMTSPLSVVNVRKSSTSSCIWRTVLHVGKPQ